MSPGSKSSKFARDRARLAARAAGLRLRAETLQAVRRFFLDEGYLEVETPLLIPAPAPETHIDAVPAGDGYLQTSPELCMKRLLSAGYSLIFQIGRCFRQGERGDLHLPEFTMLEWYETDRDYRDLMETCERMIPFVSRQLGIGDRIRYQGREIDLRTPWERISVREAFDRHAGVSMKRALESGRFDEIMVSEIEPRMGSPRPSFLMDYPASLAALARLKEPGRDVAERFELYMGGVEIANAFSELIDADEQRRRFEKERSVREKNGRTLYPMPERFLAALPHMPPSAGIALGLDRLVMVLADRERIDDVVAFTPEDL
ncbi:MAG: EF-P lysine aminoacylase GenX [Deltaproteobacteria bacterium]|nr:EF-P lysine aminoacylase GenX [Deltaproteobacteria bacterium]